MAEDSGQLFLAALKLPQEDALFGQVNERAAAFARDRAGELVTDVDDATRARIAEIIAGGLEDNLGLDGIISLLQEGDLFSADRADLIARTEVAAANEQGALNGMRVAQDAGVRLQKVWLPDADACDDCLDNADDGPIDLDDIFSSGDDAPPAHPNCRCDLASDVEEDDEDSEGEDE